jgi:hypothetical protein
MPPLMREFRTLQSEVTVRPPFTVALAIEPLGHVDAAKPLLGVVRPNRRTAAKESRLSSLNVYSRSSPFIFNERLEWANCQITCSRAWAGREFLHVINAAPII